MRILQEHLPQLQESLREGGFSGLNVSVGGGRENGQGAESHDDARVAFSSRAAESQSGEWENLGETPIWQLEQNQIDYSA